MRDRIGNLPADLTSFIGRHREVAEVRTHLSASRLVTLTGAGGVGKTRLAIKVADGSRRAFRHGVWFIELAALDDSALVAETVATALGVVQQSSREPLPQLHHYLADKHLLVVLDNCEHLVHACAELVDDLLKAAPWVRFMVTSRQSLGLFGERIFTVPPLTTPRPGTGSDAALLDQFDSVALLRARAVDHAPQFEVTEENCDSVARLCERLDGIPLAVELAAARLRSLSANEVLERLDHRFDLLTSGSSAAPPRQQTLRALIDWSYALCSVKEQTLWARLSVFSRSFALDSVEEVCSGDSLVGGEMIDLLDGLVRKSIVIAEFTGGRARYQLLETVREYGADRLAAAGERERLRLAHQDHFHRLAEQSFEQWFGPNQATWLERVRADHANLASAFDRYIESGRADRACALAAALQWYWIAGGRLGEARRWLNQALSLTSEPSPARANAMWVDAHLALLRGDVSAARARLDSVEELMPIVDAPKLRGDIAQLRGMAALFAGDLTEARNRYERAIQRHENHGETTGVVFAAFQLAVVYAFAGEFVRAAALCEKSLSLSARYDERWAASYTLWALALKKWLDWDFTGATELANDSLRIKLEFRDVLGNAYVIELLSWIAASEGRYAESARLLGTAGAIWDNLGTSMAAFSSHLAACHTATKTRVHDALGERRAGSLIAEGARLGAEEVVLRATGTAETQKPSSQVAGSRLTDRELEVARLVAKGMTNREIAANLVLSSRTIDSHVQHILAKLGFHTRSQIAGWIAGAVDPAHHPD
ncbi:LuxR C-terminal-related transcriptional regulator [Nocardia sp. R6R-6]|uniref:LuxR C-terminal-related transcriptional regulator n=1 Tax=Nocardia sp. R6R-6 TaxID=3459303 RepID=UPI00403DDA75